MKHLKLCILYLLLLSFNGCNTLFVSQQNAGNIPNDFYELGQVISKNNTEEIDIEMVNNLPVCLVKINGKEYKFLIDSGALTLIPEDIFEELNLKVNFTNSFRDINNKSKPTRYTVLPSLKLNNLEFKNIGCVVLSVDKPLKCFYHGIIGANLMAKMNWKFDYQNNKLFAIKKGEVIESDEFDFLIRFKTNRQKTPIFQGSVYNKNLSYIFDTGYSGGVKVPNEYDFYKNNSSENQFITSIGYHTIGLYGMGNYTKSFKLKTDFKIGDHVFYDELIEGGAKALIGNSFLKDYVFTIDWSTQRIYFKRNSEIPPKSVEDFGYMALFVGNKVKVVKLVEEANLPLELGDEILVMNSTVFSNIENLDVCDYMLRNGEKRMDEVNLSIKRNADTLHYHFVRQVLIK